MDSLFTRLKSAREAKHLTLVDIAEATLIDEKFLRAIEEGNTSLLPQTYSRAFIRAYARVVGLDPTEMMRLYDGAPEPVKSEEVPTPAAGHPSSSNHVNQDETSRLKLRMRNGISAFLVLALIGVGIWNLTKKESELPVQEIPFQSVVKENEQRANPEILSHQESPEQKAAPGTSDSLSLSATTTDSVWVHMILDGKEEREYLFKPNASATWKAKDQFEISLGNAGVIEFTLNGRKLGTLGKRGAVVRSAILNRDSITKN